MNNIQLAIFISETIIIALLVLFLFRMKSRFGLTPLYVTLGVFQPIQALLASTVYVEILPGVIVSPGSVIMFTASQFVILLVYICEDAIETRKAIYGIVFANLTMTLLLFILGVQLELLHTLNFLDLSPEILNRNARIMLTGTIVLFADVVLIIFVYEAIWRLITKNLFLRIYLTMALVLSFDSLAFVTGAFYDQPNYVTILTSAIIGKLVMAAFYALILAVYLRLANPTDRQTQPFQDIFYILSYRQKFEIEHQRGQQTELLLRESEGKYQTLARISPVGIFRTDANGITTYVNPKWCEISGVSFDKALGDGWLDAVHPNDKERVYQGWQEATQLKKESSSDYRFVHPDGTIAWVMGRAVPEINSENQIIGYVGTITDITERRRAEEQIERQLQRLNTLHSIDSVIKSGLDLRTTLDLLMEQISSQLKVDAVSVLLLKKDSLMLEYMASRGFRSNATKHTKLEAGEGYAGRAILSEKIVYIPDLAHTTGDLSKALSQAGENFTTYFGVPLIVKGQTIGVLEIFHRLLLSPDPEWLGFLELLADQTAIAIDHAQLFESLQRSNFELTMAYDSTIEGWSRALDLRDKETEGHTLRVTEKALELARLMELSEDELVHMRRGALLHDIGKMGVPDGILLKEGKLTDEEWEIMRKHPSFAYELLSPIRYLKSADIDVPYCHHEKWDGTGYPRKLKGQQIPITARIFAVVDVWDAITSDRPYRSAWSKEKAMAYIKKQSGKQFDPQVVDAFLKLIS